MTRCRSIASSACRRAATRSPVSERHGGRAVERPSSCDRGTRIGLERGLQPAATFGDVAADRPEAPDRATQPLHRFAAAGCLQVIECRPYVGVLVLESIQPGLRAPGEVRPRFLGERDEPFGMSSPQFVFFARLLEALDCVFADRLEHPVAGLAGCGPLAQEALVEERLQGVRVGSGGLFGGLVGAAADEDREPREEPLLVLREEAVTPLDRRPQRLLAGICITIALQQVEPLR